MTKIRNKQIKFDSDLSFTTLKKIINLASGTGENDAINAGQLTAAQIANANALAAAQLINASQLATATNNLQSIINNFEWQPSVLTVNGLDPSVYTPSVGDRYLIKGVGVGAWAGKDNQIAEWSGSAWVYTVPTMGMFVSSDVEPTKLYLYGGSWESKYFEATTASDGLTKVGFDVRLDVASATFIEGVQDAVGGFLADTATINFTYDDATNSITADLIADSISETFLKGLGIGTGGQILTSNGTGGFVWAAPVAAVTEKRSVTASEVTTGNAQLSVIDCFEAPGVGAENPRPQTIPNVYINGYMVVPAYSDAERATSNCYFGTSAGTAVALSQLDGTENLYWNGVVAGYDLDAADEVVVTFTI